MLVPAVHGVVGWAKLTPLGCSRWPSPGALGLQLLLPALQRDAVPTHLLIFAASQAAGMLLEAGCDPHSKDERGATAAELALLNGHEACAAVRLLTAIAMPTGAEGSQRQAIAAATYGGGSGVAAVRQGSK
jgi:hypothetical protein